jgi:hypothetical protein
MMGWDNRTYPRQPGRSEAKSRDRNASNACLVPIRVRAPKSDSADVCSVGERSREHTDFAVAVRDDGRANNSTNEPRE